MNGRRRSILTGMKLGVLTMLILLTATVSFQKNGPVRIVGVDAPETKTTQNRVKPNESREKRLTKEEEWAQKFRAANQEIINEALAKFDPAIREYLVSIPIVEGAVRTAVSQPKVPRIILSKDWDKTYRESVWWESHFQYWNVNKDDPVFSKDFKLQLFVHEYLHHAPVKTKLDLQGFCSEVHAWYEDPAWGSAAVNGNYVKFILFWYVYGGNGLINKYGCPSSTEEFAHIGWYIATGNKARLNELPQAIIEYYRGILRDEFFPPKNSHQIFDGNFSYNPPRKRTFERRCVFASISRFQHVSGQLE